MKSHIRKGLGKLGSSLLSCLSESGREVFNIKDAEAAIGIKGPRLRKLLHDLMKNRWIDRIERGKYLLLPLEAGPRSIHGTHPFKIIRSLINPYYIGFASALNHHGISEQVGRTIFVATTKRKKIIEFQSYKFHFVTLAKNRFFGYGTEWMGKHTFNISDKEKTVVDCLFIPKYSGGMTEVVKAFREKLDYEKMYEYALKCEDLATVKRLGYLFDLLNIKSGITEKLLKRVDGGFCLLDTGGPKKGPKNKKWRIIENIRKKDLLVEL
jgi:predicted transcriptional regulator of viral defense system